MSEDERVLIVGGGLAGLSAAAFLAWHGVPCTLVERHTDVSPHPRARGINPRTMELMRRLGLAEAIRGAPSATALRANSGLIVMETLAGREAGTLIDRYMMDVHADLGALTPMAWCLCHQAEFEPILRDYALRHGAELCFGTELDAFCTEPDGVVARLRDRRTGEMRSARASYLIAADGPESMVRDRLGIAFPDEAPPAHFMNIHFRADLRAALGDRRFIMAYTFKPFRSGLMPMDNAYEWLLHVAFDPAADGPEPFGDDRCTDLVRAVSGVADLPVRVLGAMPWRSAARTAARYRDGRVFLVGDSAHVMPPSGAFGANLAVQDAFDLAWKIAAVLRGEAGTGLLDSYDAERRPAGAATVRQAVLRSADRPRLAGEKSRPPDPEIVPDTTVWFGSRYVSRAVPGVEDDGEPRGAGGYWAGEPCGAPGTRAPHVWLDAETEGAGDGTGSTLDLFGPVSTLIAGPAGAAWATAGERAAARLGVRLRTYRMADGAPDATEWCRRYGVGPAGGVLVRPDGVVAWRADLPAADAGDTLLGALATMLDRRM